MTSRSQTYSCVKITKAIQDLFTMGWLWSSSPTPSPTSASVPDEPSQPSSGIALSEAQKARIFGQVPIPSLSRGSANTASSQAPSAESQQTDAELDAFLKALDQPVSEADTSTAQESSRPSIPTKHERILPDGRLNISPDALYPRSMSCRDAFDQAFYCQSFGGKFNDVYRYGAVKECSEHWGAFWFCMRIRTLPGKDKEEQIADFYRTRDEKRKRLWGSSEDVWDLRDKAVEKAFWRDPDADEGEFEPAVKQ
nr:early meiotic induction protein 1 [Quercus suber]